MKIIHLIDNFGVSGGVNSFVYDLCFALNDAGQNVCLIAVMNNHGETNSQVDKLRSKGILAICLGARDKKDAILHYISKLRKLLIKLAEGGQVICNLHLKLSVLMGSIATAGIKNISCVETYHSMYRHYWLENFVLQPFVRQYIACSHSAKDEMMNRFPYIKKKIVCVPNGVDIKQIRIRQNRQENHTEKTDMTLLVSVGRMTKQKNFVCFCHAIKELKEKNITYCLIGDGPDRNRIDEIICDNKNIFIVPFMDREKLLDYVAQADAVVMPSLWEGLSIFLLEAISLGKPLILSDIDSFCNTMHEIKLQEGERFRICRWGYLVSASDENAYMEAVMHFISNVGIHKNMSDAVTKISEEYDISNTAVNYMKVYQRILAAEVECEEHQ